MKNLVTLVAMATLMPFTLGVGTAFALPHPAVNCDIGSTDEITFTVAANSADTVEVSNTSGSTIGIYAAFADPDSVSGSVSISGGATLITFPSNSSATITHALPSPTYILIQPFGSDVTVQLTCNPGSGSGNILQSTTGAAAYASNMTRQQQRDALFNTLSGLDNVKKRDADHASGLYGLSEAEREQLIVSALGAQIYGFMDLLAYLYTIDPDSESNPFGSRALLERYIKFIEGCVQSLIGNYESTLVLNSLFAYAPQLRPASSALDAIDNAAGSNVVSHTFNLLGYGANGGVGSGAVISSGNDWSVSTHTSAAISQTRQAGGSVDAASGRTSINAVGSLNETTAMGLGVTVGATSEWGQAVSNMAWHYGLDVLVMHSIAPNLTLTGGVGYELTSHNLTEAGGTGSVSSNLYTANIGLTGSTRWRQYKLTPTFEVAVDHENMASVTLPGGTVVPGFERTTGRATVGTQISEMYVLTGENGIMVVTPRAGADASLSLSHREETGRTATTSFGYGLGLSGGVELAFESGLVFDLTTRVNASADTIGASVTGKLTGKF